MSYFDDRLKIGKYAEKILDEYLNHKGLHVFEVSREDEDRGIDRIVDDGHSSMTVEYKADFRAADTGNIFLEHTKNDNNGGKPGWARTSQADLLIYYIPPQGLAYLFDMKIMQANYHSIVEGLKLGKVLLNPGYTAQGYLLPMEKAIHINSYLGLFVLDSYTEEELLYKFDYEMLH